MKPNDELTKIEEKLNEIKSYYEKLSSLYSLKDDLVKVDKENALSMQLNKTIEENEKKFNDLLEKMMLSNSIYEDIKKNEEYFNQVISGTTTNRLQFINKLLSDDNLKSLDNKNIELKERYEDIVNNPKYGDITANIIDYNEAVNTVYNNLFEKENGEKSKKEKIEEIYEDFLEKFGVIVVGNEDGDSISKQITDFHEEFKIKNEELNEFYNKIFVSEENKVSLKSELADRLEKLKEIEKEAKKVIDLSSDAGLAGGFYQRGKEARKNKYFSVGIFVLALWFIGYYNFNTIDFSKLADIDIISISVRLMINAPFIWIATVANINLNKYSRLEEEYGHKESLAKSFERYKEEIKKLEDNEKSKELLAKLMETNLTAFEMNPADTMDSAKSDMPNVKP